MADKLVFPRIPENNWWTIRSQFKKTLPALVTPTYLGPLLSLSDKAAKNLIPQLKQLKLIDDDGKPTPRANDWRTDAKYEEVCHEILAEVYPQEIRDLFAGSNIERPALIQWFMQSAALGQGAATGNAAMYLLLTSGLKQLPEEGPKKKAQKTAAAKGSVTKVNGSIPVTREPVREEVPPTSSAKPPLNQVTLHIDLQVHISPDASAQQVDAIFASIAQHLYRKP